MIAAKANPEVFREYLQVEKETGHKFRLSLSLADVQEALDKGEEAGPMDEKWNM